MSEVIKLNTKRQTLEQELQEKGFTPDGIEWLMGRIQRYNNAAYQMGWEDCQDKYDSALDKIEGGHE